MHVTSVAVSLCVCALAITSVIAIVSLYVDFGSHVRDCQPVCGLWQSYQWLSAYVRASAIASVTVTVSLCTGFGCHTYQWLSVCVSVTPRRLQKTVEWDQRKAPEIPKKIRKEKAGKFLICTHAITDKPPKINDYMYTSGIVCNVWCYVLFYTETTKLSSAVSE